MAPAISQPILRKLTQVQTPRSAGYLVDEGRYTDEELISKETPLSGVFGVENAGHSWEALQ
jgi:hypothetical protein